MDVNYGIKINKPASDVDTKTIENEITSELGDLPSITSNAETER